MESLTSYRLLPLLEFFHHRHPRVRLSLRTTIGDETRQALRQGTYDVGFLMEEDTEHPGLDVVVLAREPLAPVAAPGDPLALSTQLAWRAGKRLPSHARLFVERARRLVSEESGPRA